MAMENMTVNAVSGIRSFLLKLTLTIGAATLVTLFMPNTERPRLTYVVGEPWTSAQLISPGEIFIQKDKKLVEQEQEDLLKAEYRPYYVIDTKAAERQTERFMKNYSEYSEGVEGVSAYSMQHAAAVMKEILEKGIMSETDHQQLLANDSAAEIMLIGANNQASRQRVADILSTKQAYELVFQDKSLAQIRTQLQQFDLNDYLTENISYDLKRSDQARKDLLSMIPTNSGLMKQGQEIIDRGEIVTEEKARMIDSYNDFVTNTSQETVTDVLFRNGIQWMYVMLLIGALMCYLQYFRKEFLQKTNSLWMIFTLITIFPIINSLLVRFDPRSTYLLPICIAPMFIRVFLDSRTAYMAHIMTVMLCAATVTEKFEYIGVQIVAGTATICALIEVSRRSQIIITSVIITASSLVAYTLVKYLDNNDITFELLKYGYVSICINGILLMLAYPLMFLVEKGFGFVSSVTLIELSDTNKRLLRRLSEEAPGTFQHSIMVSNLASAVAQEIGAQALLVRTGAMYHDIGKLVNPIFFTENQNGVNPHSRLTPQESADIIIGHVKEGLQLTKQEGIPEVLRNFIRTHHGKSLARYFYVTYRNEHQDEDIDERPFRYAGPDPFSKEQAILMMCDAVEAASRSLPEYTEEAITELVNKIINSQVSDGHFAECPITFKDIATTKRVLIEKLKSIYHTRIAYPE